MHLVDPSTLEVAATLTNPDGVPARCLFAVPSSDRLLLVSSNGRISDWSTAGELRAVSEELFGVPIGCRQKEWRPRWSRDGRRALITASEQVWLLTIDPPEIVGVLLGQMQKTGARFLDEDRGILLQTGRGARLFTMDGAPLRTFDCDDCIWSPDGSFVAINRTDPSHASQVVDLATGEERWRASETRVEQWSPSGQWLYGWTSSGPGILDAATGAPVASWSTVGNACCGAYDASWIGDVFVQTYGDRLALWRGSRAVQVVDRLDTLGESWIEVSHRRDRFVTLDAIFDLHGVRLADLERSDRADERPEAWSVNDAYVEGSTRDGRVVWDAENGRILIEIPVGDPTSETYWSPDGRYLFVTKGKELLRWDAEAGVVKVPMRASKRGRVRSIPQ